ncbi:unnamed protein product [Angiostrongylus costaricensis]|uniref:Metalloendopeptidase n=1 Tax=Angiostrongylus costaricensis TaxID=334426 RepID=A0A0R3PCR8_ANGCS|nr:unnamed protein product [Angiostrongylus costaricensis]
MLPCPMKWTPRSVPLHEVKAIETAFASYTKKTCIRFQPRKDEVDFLNIVKGYGCYSQVGRTGGKQEISLGRGCLHHEIIVHELMHSLGFWHEHSRDDRDEHIRIRWENILPGMESQFDKVSAFLQDTQGEKYDYRSIMHYDSTAFSRNGRHTIETINKLYQCPSISHGNQQRTWSTTTTELVDIVEEFKLAQDGTYSPSLRDKKATCCSQDLYNLVYILHLSTSSLSVLHIAACQDHFTDCLHFTQYCQRASFFFVMKTYCPQTCGHCMELDN